MMYCVTIVIVAVIVCATIIFPTLLEFRAMKFKKLKQELEDTRGKLRDANNRIIFLGEEHERQVSSTIEEFTRLYDKLEKIINRQFELTNKLEKGGKE